MHVRVLGSAAGGGFPQWNCSCRTCHGVRHGTLRAQPRTQSSIAVRGSQGRWVLINASPDIRAQMEKCTPLEGSDKVRDTALAGIILMDSQVDHTAGLLSLREGAPLPIYCTSVVVRELTENFPLFPLLNTYCGIQHHEVKVGQSFTVEGAPGLRFHPINIESASPPYSPHRHEVVEGATLGLVIEDVDNGRKLFYAPGLGKVAAETKQAMEKADCLLVDGTFWHSNDMEVAGITGKRAEEMGHLPLDGPGGLLSTLQKVSGRKILIHINNTNPILDEDSKERRQLEAAGVQVAWDGMDILL